MNEITVIPSVTHQVGFVTFNNYDEILSQAQELAEYVSSVVVTEESVKTTKKMLAAVNKKVTELEDGRKAIKKELLAPYEEFEKQIKAIAKVVKDADSIVRSQVRELEEREREEKLDTIVTLYRKREKLYPICDIFAPSDFLKPQHLNKTISLDKVEKEMVEWFEQKKKDIEYIKTLEHSDEVLVEYIQNQDVITSVSIVNGRNEKIAAITKPETVIQNTVTIVIDGNDLAHVEFLLNNSNIKYEIKGRM